MIPCKFLGQLRVHRPEGAIHHCEHFHKSCVVADSIVHVPGGTMPSCVRCQRNDEGYEPLVQLSSAEYNRPLVSCIIPTYNMPNRLDCLEEAVESFLRQDYPNKELIVIIDSAGQVIQFDHPQVTVINHASRFASLGEKLNYAILHSKGELICRFDDDDISQPWRMSQQVEILSNGFDYCVPSHAWSFGGGEYHFQDKGCYANTMGMFSRSAWSDVGGFSMRKQCDADVLLDSELKKSHKWKCYGTTEETAPYIVQWDTGRDHFSGYGIEGSVHLYDEFGTKGTAGTYKLKPHWNRDYSQLGKPVLRGAEVKSNFCYYTATNMVSNIPMIEAMIWSARQAGVQEDIHVWSHGSVHDAINHPWPASRPWDHMQKLEIMRDHLAVMPYEYSAWLDSDTWFIRHPGDLTPLIRDNQFFVQGESEITSPNVHLSEWWGCPIARLIHEFRSRGIAHDKLWSTNGGLFIFRNKGCEPLIDKAFEIQRYFVQYIHQTTTDETALAFLGHLYVEDPMLNRKELTGAIHGCDWRGNYVDVRPNGTKHQWQDWLTADKWTHDPPLVHCMRAKTWMRDEGVRLAAIAAEEWRLGDQVESALSVIGITKDRVSKWWGAPCNCPARQMKINKFSTAVQKWWNSGKSQQDLEAITKLVP